MEATRLSENNQLFLTGVISTPFEFSHEVFGEKFYVTYLSIMRFSGNQDLIPVIVSDRLISDVEKENFIGKWARIEGEYRSYNKRDENSLKNKSTLVLSAFAKTFTVLNENDQEADDANDIYLEGFICKPVTARNTPLGRTLADMLLAVNAKYGKSNYIPCICWSRNALFAERLEVGDKVCLSGRVQSREYIKHYGDGRESEYKTAYEVSVSKIEKV